jgi:hypothetical protein
VGWAQKYPESLLAKLVDARTETDGVMVESADAQPVTIHIDRDPALFAHVVKSFDAPVPAEDTEQLLQELDYFGMLSLDVMPAVSAIIDKQASHVQRFELRCSKLVSRLMGQMAKLVNEKLLGMCDEKMTDALDEGRTAAKELHFVLSKPTDRWTEMQVRLEEAWNPETDKDVWNVPAHIMKPLETRLRHLGYSVSVTEDRYSYATTGFRLSWA